MQDIFNTIRERAASLQDISVKRRRDFHQYPETGWLEMRTTILIERRLRTLGYEVLTGRDVCLENARLGVPPVETLRQHADLVLTQGIHKEELTKDLREGFTGVIGILHCGNSKDNTAEKSPVVALRFDIDALPMTECRELTHRPAREGFASRNPGMMHACGHDGHITIGLAVAEILMELRDRLNGTIKLIFQPGEEGGRGAVPIVAHGHLDDVDYFIGNHVAPTRSLDDGDITPGTYGSLANTKYNVYFHGKASHAGGYPEKGNNALLAAAEATVGLYAIPRHSGGQTRINVGTLNAGSARNVIPDEAKLEMEVRGETTEINDYMSERARQVIEGAAMMNGCTVEMKTEGRGETQHSDLHFIKRIHALIDREYPEYKISSIDNARNWGSEDISVMMNRVQSHGGMATYMRTMTDMESAQHTVNFDFDERVLETGTVLFSAIVADILG